MEDLSKEWDLPNPLQQSAESEYTVALDEGLKFKIQSPSIDNYYFFCELGEIPSSNEEPLYTKALLGNLFGQGTNNNLLGLNENGTILTLSRLIDYHISFKDFKEVVEDFINTIDFWREEIAPKR